MNIVFNNMEKDYLYRITLCDSKAAHGNYNDDDISTGYDIFEDITEISNTDIKLVEKLNHRFERIIYGIENRE